MSHDHHVHEQPRAAAPPPKSEPEHVTDPVCDMGVEREPVATVATEWVCPMHPQIVRGAPGTCPICGMALEPRTVSAGGNPELRDMRRRFWVSAALTVPLVLAAMAEMIGLELGRSLSARAMAWIQLALATPVVAWGGAPFFARGWRSIVNRSLNMFTLIALGVGVAYAFSLVAVLAPGVVPMTFRMNGAVPVYFEPAAVITTLVLLGQVLELRARSATSSAIRALLDLAPRTARVIADDGSEHDAQLAAVGVGARLRVRPGEKVPVDGVVLDGTSAVDESMVMLTGDSRTTARAVAARLGIDEVIAEVLPDGKAQAIAKLKAEGRRVAMAGDGVNDAPALAAADVGIAMGTGADVAIESAGITLLHGDLAGIVRARRLSRATMRNIRQNLVFAFIYNALGIPIAAGVLYPAFGLLLSPMIASAAMSLSSVSVVGNALRLRRLAL